MSEKPKPSEEAVIVAIDGMVDTVPPQAPQFYLASGYAIRTWQHVETSLSMVFEKVSTCNNKKVSAAIFYTPQDFFEKIKLTHHAARLSLAATPLAEWIKLRKRMIDECEVRNALAHYPTVYAVAVGQTSKMTIRWITEAGDYFSRDPEGPAAKVGEFMLRPNTENPNEQFKDQSRKSKKSMKIIDILRARRRFETLTQDLKAFAEKIPQHEAKLQELIPPPQPSE